MAEDERSDVPPRDTSQRSGPMFENWAPLACALLAATLAGLMIVGTRDFALDDSWIHLAYAKSVRLGDGLSYNPGDWETGVSSPLWVLVLSVWPIEGNPVAPVKLLGVLAHALTAWAAASLVLDVVRERASVDHPVPAMSVALLAGVLVGTTPTLVHAATSGMEVPLAAALLLVTLRAALAGRVTAALIFGGLSVWARPEALFVFGTFGPLLTVWRHRQGDTPARVRAPAATCVGAVGALAVWVAYSLAVSGYPWPNTQYIKGAGGGFGGLDYVALEVLPLQPWIVSLTGLALLVLAVRGDVKRPRPRPESIALLLAWLVPVLAIEVSRPLHVGTQFYESRYFALVAGLPMLVVPLGLLHLPRAAPAWMRYGALALVLPVAVVCGLQVHHLRTALVEQTEDTYAVHGQVARYIADALPADAVVGVEGAGAARFFTPRTMTIVDLVGLNEGKAAHLHSHAEAKVCHFVDRGVTHLVIPMQPDFAGVYSRVFRLVPVQDFVDPHYTQTLPAGPRQVVVFEVHGVEPGAAQVCAAL